MGKIKGGKPILKPLNRVQNPGAHRRREIRTSIVARRSDKKQQ